MSELIPHALTIHEAAARWAISTDTIRRMIDAGDLPSFRYGRIIRVKAADLDAVFTRSGKGRR